MGNFFPNEMKTVPSVQNKIDTFQFFRPLSMITLAMAIPQFYRFRFRFFSNRVQLMHCSAGKVKTHFFCRRENELETPLESKKGTIDKLHRTQDSSFTYSFFSGPVTSCPRSATTASWPGWTLWTRPRRPPMRPPGSRPK